MRYFRFILYLIAATLIGCGGGSDGGGGAAPGTLTVTITDSTTGSTLKDANVIFFSADTNSPVGNTLVTANDGIASVSVAAGSYYVRVEKQSYQPSPTKDIVALAHSVVAGQTTNVSVELSPLNAVSIGTISGTTGVAGALVVATNTVDDSTASTITDNAGNYKIFNVASGDYTVKGWIAGYSSSTANAAVVADANTPDVNLTLTSGVAGSVNGQVTFLAISNGEVDVALVHPLTLEAIPGLYTTTSNANYTITNVPDGDYIARATFENDGYVVDPDWIVKFGEPSVTVSGGSVQRDFSVTGAATLTRPNNSADDTTPVVVDSLTPTFQWEAYSSASDYVVEVINASGQVIWGGFSSNWTIKNYSTTATSTTYNTGGTATAALEDGKTYRWRVFVSKDDAKEATGWKLISVSEEQHGIFKVELP